MAANPASVPPETLRRLELAITRAIPLMPADIRARFVALVSREAITSVAALLAVWGASHLLGIGEAIDVVLLGVGFLAVGDEALHVTGQFAAFVKATSSAHTDEQLNRAAQCFADAVTRVGFDAILIIATHRLSAVSRATARTSAMATEVSASVERLQSLLVDNDGVLNRLVAKAQSEKDSLDLLNRLRALEKEIPNFQGRPVLRVTRAGEWWQRASDTMAESGQDKAGIEPLTGRKLSAYDQGGYLTKKFSRSGSAVFRGWNSALVTEEQLVPEGSIVLEGKTAPQFPGGASAHGDGALPGGDSQIFHWGQLSDDGGFVRRPERATGRAWGPDGRQLSDH